MDRGKVLNPVVWSDLKTQKLPLPDGRMILSQRMNERMNEWMNI